ncbi:MAG: DNA polymerase III subunit alpha, partial [Patescibacteria group bacterium]|nr:DNA polymerase III subunit alpha [Patescibacteria group bacterium]
FKELINLAKIVEGTASHASTHAAGVVIGDKPLTEYTPLQIENKNNRIMTQYDMYSLDCNVDQNAIGLLKIDFLGLKNLTILQNAINYVQEQRNQRVDMSELPLDDPQVYKLLSQGNTIGVFQLESGGMRNVAKKLQPSRFSDITAMVALYRPGPMDLIDDFIAGKKNPAKINYPHPDLKPVLEETYGIAVYQEQALQIANVMAGYTLGEADLLRRAIGKKKRALMAKEKLKFIQQSRAKGYSKEIADRVWGYIEKFVGYGFNKAHATAYAMIAYQTAYMKTHYPVEFMAALLTAETTNKDKIPMAVAEAKKMKINVYPPDINLSSTNFTIIKDKTSLNQQAIMFGLSAIKNVGEAAIEAIIQARKTKKFTSLSDFCQQTDSQKVNKKVLESLIQIGSFDAFAKRSQLMLSMEKIRQTAAETQKIKNSPQVSMFTAAETKKTEVVDKLENTEEFSKLELLNFEKQLLGFYLTEHPLARSMDKIKHLATHQIIDLDPQINSNQTVTIGGIIKGLKIIITKKSNQEMAFANLDDDTGTVELIIFPRLFTETKSLWANDQPILVTGKVDSKDRLTIIVDTAVNPTAKLPDGNTASPTYQSPPGKNITLEIKQSTPKEVLVQLNQLFQANQGQDTLTLQLVNGDEPKEITLPYTINFSVIKSAVNDILKPENMI